MAVITKYHRGGDQNGSMAMAIAMIISMTSSGVVAGLSPQASQAAASALAALVGWAAGVPRFLAGQGTQNSNSVIKTTTVTPEKPFLVQTQDFNYRVNESLVQNAANYTYVTPAGNYTFPETSPMEMSYVSLFGNRTALSAFHVEEQSLLTEGAENLLLANQTTLEDSAEQWLGPTDQGTLACTYDFAGSPETTSCTFTEAQGITANFNIVWATSGDFLNTGYGAPTISTNGTSGLTTAGNFSSVYLGERPNSTTWERSLFLSWADTGVEAQVSYWPLGLVAMNGQLQHGVMVMFPANLATVDPSLYQSDYGSQSRSCAFSSNVTRWDTLVYAGDFYDVTPTDTYSTVFGVIGYDNSSITYGSTKYSTNSEIATAVAYSSGPDTITTPGSGGASTDDSGQVWCYELKYTGFRDDFRTSATYSYNSGTSSGPIATSSFTPTTNDFVLSYMDYGLACGRGSAYATGGWSGSSATAWLYHDGAANVCGTGNDYYVVASAVYANAWSGGSTTASMSVCGPSSTGACSATETVATFPIQGIVPFTATLDLIGSPQTITISGDGRPIPTFVGNGTQSDDIRGNAGGTVTLTLPTGYVWDMTGNATLSVPICSGGGTCSSASATYKPILDYVYTVQLTNSQSSATPATFQQAVQIPVSTLGISSYLASDIGNVVFCADFACATPLYAWIQNCQVSTCPTSSTWVNTWVKLTSAIPANSYTDIYMALLPTTTDFNSYWGEAPQLSSTYGANDNGAKVFNNYADFQGTALNEVKWGHSIDNSASLTVDNGITLKAPENGGDIAIVSHPTFSAPSIVDAYMLAPNFPNDGETVKIDVAQTLGTVANGTAWGARQRLRHTVQNVCERWRHKKRKHRP